MFSLLLVDSLVSPQWKTKIIVVSFSRQAHLSAVFHVVPNHTNGKQKKHGPIEDNGGLPESDDDGFMDH
jgi:hypothetical protein